MTDQAHGSAAEIGLPSRRKLVATLAAAPALTLPAIAEARAGVTELIDAHRRAAADYLAAVEAEEAIDDNGGAELLEVTLRQGHMHVEPDKISRAVVEKQIRDSYRGARVLAGNAHRVLCDDQIFAAQSAALDAAEAADLASVGAAFDAYESRPARLALAKAEARTARASRRDDAAMLALCSYRCKTVEEVGLRAAYLLGPAAWDKDDPLEEHVVALLRSFLLEGEANV